MSQRVSDERMEQIKDKNWCGTPIAVDLVDDLCDARKENAALKARLAILQDALADIVDDELRRVQVECSNCGVKFSDDESLLSLFMDSRIARAHRLLLDEASP